MRPNLFIVGAPKCGTTAWVEYLGSHPRIFFSKAKEPHHFSHDFPKWCWARTQQEYLALFQESGDAPVVGEGSVRYLYSRVAAREIHKFNPAAKILIFLRSQEDFLPSLHNQQLYNRDEAIENFEQVWRLSGNRSADTIPACCREPSFLDYKAMGRFREQVERFFAVFPAEQIRVLAFRDWIADPRQTYLDILDFLGLEDDGRTEFPPVNEAKHHKSRIVASLTQNPAPWVRKTSTLVTQIAGKQLGILTRLRSLNRGTGYRSAPIEPSLKQEIREYYEAENLALLPLVSWRRAGEQTRL
ncbi:sulfotransferase domain-containing protein [Sinorhizobium glycinis]|uniref:sulfotransferase domain-containing protein n=1 Tax=Sinorhizobium glycinis TaxID=1472378 RepID=UPI00139042D1|nr:sulfotransferase domain-containing protein [Sinorhizobium glycinis]